MKQKKRWHDVLPKQWAPTLAGIVSGSEAHMFQFRTGNLHVSLAMVSLFAVVSSAQASIVSMDVTANSSAEQVVLPACNGWGGKPVARTELFFGLARPDGSTIAGDEFQRFVDHEVMPRFPSGLTLLGGNGQFRDAGGTTVKENAKLLILLYPYDRDNSRKIEAIRTTYMKTYQQESVLRVDNASCVSF
jgi:hypothetical protein